VTYRVGGGERGNVAADTLTRVDAVTQAVLGIAGVSNPRPATGGRDEEPAEQVRELAPHAFRAVQQRAVRPEDYDLAVARTLPWVQRAARASATPAAAVHLHGRRSARERIAFRRASSRAR
jgi:uncharacterized phage protein gp47/JayE